MDVSQSSGVTAAHALMASGVLQLKPAGAGRIIWLQNAIASDSSYFQTFHTCNSRPNNRIRTFSHSTSWRFRTNSHSAYKFRLRSTDSSTSSDDWLAVQRLLDRLGSGSCSCLHRIHWHSWQRWEPRVSGRKGGQLN